jgi:TatD DNase family protein
VLSDCWTINNIIAASVDLKSFKTTVRIAESDKRVIPSVGLHPEMIPDSISDLDEVLQLMEEQRFVSEVGLDRRAASERESYQLQVEVFTRILETAEKHSNVLIVHSRGLEQETVDLLAQYELKHIVMHWYSGSVSVLRTIIDRGYFVSVNPAIIFYKKAQKLVRRIPLDLILTESDGPTRFGRLMSVPSDVVAVVAKLAEVLNNEQATVEQALWSNFATILGDMPRHRYLQDTLE